MSKPVVLNLFKSFLKIDFLPESLSKYSAVNFGLLFSAHPEERGKVLVYNKDETNPKWTTLNCNRWSASFGKTPKKDDNVLKSYMFEENSNRELPVDFLPFDAHFKKLDKANNQIIVNWYGDNTDYIAMHSDCEAGMIPNHTISMVNLYEDGNNENPRTFTVQNKKTLETIDVVLEHGMVITMGGEMQKHYRHGVSTLEKECPKRISVSFRQME